MEARLYAENPSTGFLPSTGRLSHLRFPDGIRVDTGVEEGKEISAYYDPMIAKLISHGATRQEAARRLARAAASVEAWPVRTNAPFLRRALDHLDFRAGTIDTGFIERHSTDLTPPAEPSKRVLQAAARAILPKPGRDIWTTVTGFRMNAPPSRE